MVINFFEPISHLLFYVQCHLTKYKHYFFEISKDFAYLIATIVPEQPYERDYAYAAE